jgi:hypothetical protein
MKKLLPILLGLMLLGGCATEVAYYPSTPPPVVYVSPAPPPIVVYPYYGPVFRPIYRPMYGPRPFYPHHR